MLPMADRQGYREVGEYGIIGNMRSAALVGLGGSIDWCCLPYFHSPAVFGRLLDHETGGRFDVWVADGSPDDQRYEPRTNVLVTDLSSPAGALRIHDFMPCYMDGGSFVSHDQITRIVRCLEGSPTVELAFEPKLDFARGDTELESVDHGYVATDGKETVTLRSDLSLEAMDGTVMGTRELDGDEAVRFVCRYGSAEAEPASAPDEQAKQLDRTERFWKRWCDRCEYDGRWSDQVLRSALTLKLLTYEPNGATVAAATTSLPEETGGTRNWDYRYAWIRDAIFSAWSFHQLGYYEPGLRFVNFLREELDPTQVPPLIDVSGDRVLEETELDHLEGYRGSSPVRVGNAAGDQSQWGSYGALIDGEYFLHKELGGIESAAYEQFVRPAVDHVCEHWHEPDHGIWEVRGDKQDFVLSKAWCWVVLDRGIKIAKAGGYWDDVDRWEDHRETIKREVIEKGWSDKRGAFTMAYDSDAIDASILLLPLLGFLSARHPKMERTIDTIVNGLGDGVLLYRYDPAEVGSDPIESDESPFTTCSFWLISCLVQQGSIEEAKERFETMLDYANHLGLYAEELDPGSGRHLGNFPQAYVHMGLITAAVQLDDALG